MTMALRLIVFRDTINTLDLRQPFRWYPIARSLKRKFIYHAGPTNSGKTYTALQVLRPHCLPIFLQRLSSNSRCHWDKGEAMECFELRPCTYLFSAFVADMIDLPSGQESELPQNRCMSSILDFCCALHTDQPDHLIPTNAVNSDMQGKPDFG